MPAHRRRVVPSVTCWLNFVKTPQWHFVPFTFTVPVSVIDSVVDSVLNSVHVSDPKIDICRD